MAENKRTRRYKRGRRREERRGRGGMLVRDGERVESSTIAILDQNTSLHILNATYEEFISMEICDLLFFHFVHCAGG